MEGEDRIRLLDRPEDGEYVITVSVDPRLPIALEKARDG